MRECTLYEQLIFLDSQQQEGDSIRDQDYTVHVNDVPYRDILLNSGCAIVARSNHEFLMGETIVTFPLFFILEPGHATRRPPRVRPGNS